LNKQKREQEQKQEILHSFKHRLKHGLLQGHKVVIEPKGVTKMSEVLEAFIEPYIHVADTDDAYRKLLSLAVLAWNVSLLPQEQQEQMIEDMIEASMPSATRREKRDFGETVAEFIERKRTYFAEHRRMILDFELTDTGKTYHLSVVATMENLPENS